MSYEHFSEHPLSGGHVFGGVPCVPRWKRACIVRASSEYPGGACSFLRTRSRCEPKEVKRLLINQGISAWRCAEAPGGAWRRLEAPGTQKAEATMGDNFALEKIAWINLPQRYYTKFFRMFQRIKICQIYTHANEMVSRKKMYQIIPDRWALLCQICPLRNLSSATFV